jgi:hypothetical protein
MRTVRVVDVSAGKTGAHDVRTRYQKIRPPDTQRPGRREVSNEIDREAVVSVTELPNESVADWLEDFVRGECMFRSDEKPAMFSEIARRLRSTPDEGRCERDARIADLERRLKEAERDSERLNWLCAWPTSNRFNDCMNKAFAKWLKEDDESSGQEDFRAAIDTAMQDGK